MARTRRRFGQHFLSNPATLRRIVRALGPRPGDRVLEIGPGPGGLTRQLLATGARVSAIEIDRDFAARLGVDLPDLALVEGDALAVDWAETAGGPGYLLTGNIPYNITTPLLDKALTPPLPNRIVLLVQKEVADRIAAGPGSSQYGGLTVGIAARMRVERLFTVPAGAFSPPPKVDSAVIRLTPLEEPLVTDDEVAGFRRFVTGIFGFRRKQLLRGLREYTGRGAVDLAETLGALGLDSTIRPERLSPSEFARLYRSVQTPGGSGYSGLAESRQL